MTEEWETHTVKSVFEGSIVSFLEVVLWLLILGSICDQGCKDNPMGPPFIGAEHGTNMSCSPVYAIVRKMDKFSISAIFSHRKVSHFKGWKRRLTFRSFWACLLEVTVSWHSPLSQLKPYCLTPLLTLVAVLSTLDFTQGAKFHSLVRVLTLWTLCSNSVVSPTPSDLPQLINS